MICRKQLERAVETEEELLEGYKAAMSEKCIAMIIGAGCTAAAYEDIKLPQ